MFIYTRKPLTNDVLGSQNCSWASETCNPEQNDTQNPFLTSILVPNGCRNMIFMVLGNVFSHGLNVVP